MSTIEQLKEDLAIDLAKAELSKPQLEAVTLAIHHYVTGVLEIASTMATETIAKYFKKF